MHKRNAATISRKPPKQLNRHAEHHMLIANYMHEYTVENFYSTNNNNK